MHWMQDGLPLLGARTTVRWLGSTAVEMAIREAEAPFAAATVIIFLEARDMPWMWALGRLRGRRDTVIIRGQLQRAPKVELEALAPKSWSAREALPRVPQEWTAREADSSVDITIYCRDDASLALGQALLDLAKRDGLAVKRLALHPSEPNFQIHISIPAEQRPARDFFKSIQSLADRALA